MSLSENLSTCSHKGARALAAQNPGPLWGGTGVYFIGGRPRGSWQVKPTTRALT